MIDIANLDPDTTPAMMPPPGVIPNFDNPESIAYQASTVIYVLMPLMFLVLGLRVYARIWMSRQFGFDDGQSETSRAGTAPRVANQACGALEVLATIAAVSTSSYLTFSPVHLWAARF